jgi:hypothetical protein
MSKPKNLFDLIHQSGQGVPETLTIQYDDGYEITAPKDLITKEYVDPMQAQLAELLPPDAESLHGKVLVMAGTTLRTGYLSADAQAAYEAGKGAGVQVDYIINDPTFTLATPNTATAVNQGDKGTFELWVNGAKTDEFDLAAHFQEANRTGIQTGLPAVSTGGMINVTSIAKYAISLYQKVNAYLTIAANSLRTGYNEIVLKHTGTTGGDQIAASYKVFYDVGTVTPTVTGLDVAPQTVSPKTLSGVVYAGMGTTVLVDATGNALVDNTYVADPITLTGLHGAPTTIIAPTDAVVTGLSNPPVVGETMTATDKVVTLSVANAASKDARITATPKDPHGTYTATTSTSKKLLVNTFGVRSTATVEHFDDETYRLPEAWNSNDTSSSVTGNWDSAALLPAGAAQQGIIADSENGLLYPAEDFTAFTPPNNANYTGRSGDAVYLRAFVTSSPKSSIQMVLYGLAAGIGQIGAGDVNVEVKLPGQSGWLDCAKPYDGSAGVNADGNGAMVGSISYSGGNATLNATFGGKSSYDANNRVLVRVRLRNASRTIKQIGTNW